MFSFVAKEDTDLYSPFLSTETKQVYYNFQPPRFEILGLIFTFVPPNHLQVLYIVHPSTITLSRLFHLILLVVK